MIKGPGAADTIRPSKIEISQADWPISRRKVVVRNRPRRTSLAVQNSASLRRRVRSCGLLNQKPHQKTRTGQRAFDSEKQERRKMMRTSESGH